MDIAAILVDAREGDGDLVVALEGGGGLDVRGGKKDQNASKKGSERECELHGEDRPMTL